MSPLSPRTVVKVIYAVEQSEGVGARVRRSIGTRELRNFPPFLMLDHFSVQQGAGFPTHPHRGFSTMTLMLKGEFIHEDNHGHKGKIGQNGLQFMTAGMGVMHSEIPWLIDTGVTACEGLQLWIDMPREKKLSQKASYQDQDPDEIPQAEPRPDVLNRIISGEALGNEKQGLLKSPVNPPGGFWCFDIQFKSPEAEVSQPLPEGWRTFIYVVDGAISIDDQKIDKYNLVILSDKPGQDYVKVKSASSNARFALVSGEPLDQPIFQHGPFVLDTKERLEEAFKDFALQRNGFENTRNFSASIDVLMHNPHAKVDVPKSKGSK